MIDDSVEVDKFFMRQQSVNLPKWALQLAISDKAKLVSGERHTDTLFKIIWPTLLNFDHTSGNILIVLQPLLAI